MVKNIKSDSFKCCTASTTSPGFPLTPDSVDHAQHGTRVCVCVCRPTNLRSGRRPFSVPIFLKGTVVTFSTVHIIQVHIVCQT